MYDQKQFYDRFYRIGVDLLTYNSRYKFAAGFFHSLTSSAMCVF